MLNRSTIQNLGLYVILSDNSGSADEIIVPYEKRIKFVMKYVFEVEMLDAGMQADVTGVFTVFSYTIARPIHYARQ